VEEFSFPEKETDGFSGEAASCKIIRITFWRVAFLKKYAVLFGITRLFLKEWTKLREELNSSGGHGRNGKPERLLEMRSVGEVRLFISDANMEETILEASFQPWPEMAPLESRLHLWRLS
jgi:hypothetical protein